MKHKNTLSTVLLAITAIVFACCRDVFGNGKREECTNSASTVGTHENGIIPCIAEVTFGSRYLLAQKGSAATGVIINIATTRPRGVCLDEPSYDSSKVTKAALALLGCAAGTLRMVASGVIAADAPVYSAAAGKVSATAASGSYLVGFAVTAAGADNDVIEVAHCAPQPATTPAVIVAAAGGAVTALQATGGAVLSNAGASGAAAFTLPAALVGMRVAAVVEAAQELRIDPDGTETIALPSTGVQGAAGKYLVADAVGETVQLICLTAGTWDVLSYAGTWTAQG